jgi:cytochrome o ubiquinol oxidase subunit II
VKRRLLFFSILVIIITILGVILLKDHRIAVLMPMGEIALQQRNLIVFTFLLSLVVIIPVFTLLFFISWKYRIGNKKNANYIPDWAGNKWLEVIWWGIPCVIILILSIVTWQTSHQLDPYKSLSSSVKPLEVQVVALQWKWLFIYPEQGIATVNFLEFPEKTPINFTITADAPMNSFWIPSLGGQVYAMSGMSTKLHLMADGIGEYRGSSANISGEHFADMNFKAQSVKASVFDIWAKKIKNSSENLTMTTYNRLSNPSVPKTRQQYALTDLGLYDKILMKYMGPMDHNDEGHDMESMSEMEGM